MRIQLLAAGIFAALGAMAAPVVAATITYDFTTVTASTHDASLVDAGSGLTLDVEAYKVFNPTGAETDGLIRANSNGWGVFGNPAGGQVGASEALALSFGNAVKLDEVAITSNGNTTLNIFDYLTETFLGSVTLTGSGFKTLDLSALNFAGDSFVVQRGGGATFFLSSVSVSAIPLPAGALLLLSGLGALGIARRRKS